MANGDEISCNGCESFRWETADPSRKLVHVREPGAKFFCLRHKVVLPFQQTHRYLICRDWKHLKTREEIAAHTRNKYDGGTLYVYESLYAPEWTEFAKFSNLPVISNPPGPR